MKNPSDPVNRPAVRTLRSVPSSLLLWAIMLIAVAPYMRAQGPIYGPPAIALFGTLYTYSATGDLTENGPSGDIYLATDGSPIVLDQNHILFLPVTSAIMYDPVAQDFYDGVSGPGAVLHDVVPVSSDGNFIAPPGLTVRTNYALSGVWDGQQTRYPDYEYQAGAAFVAKFQNLPDNLIFQIDASPFYIYHQGGTEMVIDASTGVWPPPSNLFLSPPQTVYTLVSGDTSSTPWSIATVNTAWGQGWYTEELNYCDSNGQIDCTVHRYYTWGGFTGDISGFADGTVSYSGSFDPINVQVSNIISNPAVYIAFSPLTAGAPAQGPPYISWDGTLLAFVYTDSNGVDNYIDGLHQTMITIDSALSVLGTSTSATASGHYDTSMSTFDIGGNFFAMSSDGNPIGLPTGLTMLFGASGIGKSIYTSDNSSAHIATSNYSYQRPDGYWGVKYIGLPSSNWLVIADASGNYDSQIYITTDTSTEDNVIDAVSGWPVSNAFPGHVYVNGALCLLNWTATNFIGGPGYTNGGALYKTVDQTVSVTLSWDWNGGAVAWTWTMNTGTWAGNSGTWDGVNTFSNLPFGLSITLNPARSTPTNGPASIAWNGAPLTYNAAASGMLNADVYDGSYGGHPIRVAIDASGNVAVYSNNSASPTFTGTYNSVSQLFDFGTANTGTVASVDSSNNILGTTSSSGSLDVPGNVFSMGSWLNEAGESVAGLVLAFSPPTAPDQPAHLRLASTVALTDWLWSRSTTDGAPTQQAAMELDPANRLLLYSPGGDAAAKIALDPVNGADFQVPVRVLPAGDINMGNFHTGSQPGQ